MLSRASVGRLISAHIRANADKSQLHSSIHGTRMLKRATMQHHLRRICEAPTPCRNPPPWTQCVGALAPAPAWGFPQPMTQCSMWTKTRCTRCDRPHCAEHGRRVFKAKGPQSLKYFQSHVTLVTLAMFTFYICFVWTLSLFLSRDLMGRTISTRAIQVCRTDRMAFKNRSTSSMSIITCTRWSAAFLQTRLALIQTYVL